MFADAYTMLQNFSTVVPELMRLTTATAYVMGMVFVIKAVLLIKGLNGNSNPPITMYSVLSKAFAGAALLYLPSAVKTSTATFFTNNVPYAYVTDQIDPYQDFINTIVSLIVLVGLVSFIRGLVILGRQAHQNEHPMGKALAHLVGGIFCINIRMTVTAVFTTLGYGA